MFIGIDAITENWPKKTGVEWYAHHLLKEMIKIPSENQFVLYSSSSLKLDLPCEIRRRRSDQAAISEGEPKNWQNKVLVWPFVYLWSQVRLSWQMIFSPPDILFVPVRALPLIHPKKSVFTVHDLGFEVFPECYSFFKRNYTRFLYRRALKECVKIFVPSSFTKREILRLYRIGEQKIKVIPLGFDQNVFNPLKNEEKNKEILRKYEIKKPFVFYLGRKEKKKNLVNLLKAWQILKEKGFEDLTLVLAGSPGYGYQEIACLIAKTRMVKEIAYLKEEEVKSFYQEAEFFVFPSFYEGFGLPLLEAMACKCPVVSSSLPSLKEIGDRAALYFEPENVKEIALRMEEVLKNKTLKEELEKKGLERVKNFSWQKCAAETMQEIENL